MTNTGQDNLTWKFPKAFWTANAVELLERAAWYGVFIAITLYLSRILAFSDIQAAAISGGLSAGIYFLPTFAGAAADKMGFRRALVLAFGLLTIGYAGMGILPTLLESSGLVKYGMETEFTGLRESGYKWMIVPVVVFVMVGGSFIKSCITGTVARETNEANRARGYSIFYAMVNIGAFSGKTIVKPLRESMGDEGLLTLNYFSAAATLLAVFVVLFFYKSAKSAGESKSLGEIWAAFIRVLKNKRLVALILIITGFWMVQHQLYATMPKYVLRMAGEDASPSWYANVNPLVVVLTVTVITQLMRKRTALFSMIVGMCIMPISAMCMATGNMIDGDGTILSMHPIAFMMVVGICFQGLAESFISPRFLEYFSFQAPKGEEGLYLGFSHLHSFVSSLLGFITSGFLLTAFCPDPKLFEGGRESSEWIAASSNAHYIWIFFAGVACTSVIALLIFAKVTSQKAK